jgi:hypothetical protein
MLAVRRTGAGDPTRSMYEHVQLIKNAAGG